MFETDNKVFEERREIFLNKLNGKAAIIPGANLVKHHADCEYPFRQDSNFGLTLFSIAFYILVVLVGEVLPKALGTRFSVQIALFRFLS